MVRITGDIHGEEGRFYYDYGCRMGQILPQFQDMTEGDTLIIAGDAGFLWDESPRRKEILAHFSMLPFTVAYVDGNHENFDMLYRCPVETWNGGRVHRVAKNIVHLMRGECFTIEGRRFFCFGGAASTDRGYGSTSLFPWWPQELPSHAEYERALETLAHHGQAIDYIIAHTCPSFLIPSLGGYYGADLKDAYLTGFLSDVARVYAPNFKCFYFGHWHLDTALHGGRYRALFHDVVDVETDETPRGCP